MHEPPNLSIRLIISERTQKAGDVECRSLVPTGNKGLYLDTLSTETTLLVLRCDFLVDKEHMTCSDSSNEYLSTDKSQVQVEPRWERGITTFSFGKRTKRSR